MSTYSAEETNFQVSVLDGLDGVDAASWNALAGDSNPFIRYEFLSALERHGCLGRRWGWIPQHVAVYDNDTLIGAAPLYLKDNSYGEFVFDWAWADAYERNDLPYYPKLVGAIPYTPVTGARLLAARDRNHEPIRARIVQAGLEHAQALGVSSLHWLFTNPGETALLERHGLMRRMGCQFHWHNDVYRNFDDFLMRLGSKRRKEVRRERRHVREAGVDIEVLHGDEVGDEQWAMLHRFYCSTFDRKFGYPTLTEEFFQCLGQSMPKQVVLVLARHRGRYIAGAFNLRGADALFGRHWGCSEHVRSLHFEACYYSAIEYCIEQGLRRFEAGAQGEHKLSRGFVPVPTYSAHWLRSPLFRNAIGDFLVREQQAMRDYMDAADEHLPYKRLAPGKQHEAPDAR